MPGKKRQHFVPQFYLKNFSNGGSGKTIGVFNLKSNLFIKEAKLKTQAYEDNFYGADGAIEDILGILESKAALIIKDIIEYGRLPVPLSSEYQHILTFAILQHARTVYAVEEHNEMFDKTVKTVFSRDPRLEVTLDSLKITLKNPTAYALFGTVQALSIAYDLKCKILINRSGAPFITSDNPVVYYNQFFEPFQSLIATTGLAWKGLEILFPISPSHFLMFYDAEVYKIGSRNHNVVQISDSKDIVALNRLQYLNGLENLYFNDYLTESDLCSIVRGAKRYRRLTKVNAREYQERTDEEGIHSLFFTTKKEVRCNLKLGFVRILKKAKNYDIGNRVMHVRNGAARRTHEITSKRGKEGYQIEDLSTFLRDFGLTAKSEPSDS